MPMVGVDWSQNGVAHLFSAIKVCNCTSRQNYLISFPNLAQDNGNIFIIIFIPIRQDSPNV
jgi:phosphatidate phosphatase PAH1